MEQFTDTDALTFYDVQKLYKLVNMLLNVTLQSQQGAAADAFTKAFIRNCLPEMKDEDIEESLVRKAVVLEYKRPKKKNKGKTRKAKGLNAKERRQLKIFQLKPEHQKYTLFHPVVVYYVSKSTAYH